MADPTASLAPLTFADVLDTWTYSSCTLRLWFVTKNVNLTTAEKIFDEHDGKPTAVRIEEVFTHFRLAFVPAYLSYSLGGAQAQAPQPAQPDALPYKAIAEMHAAAIGGVMGAKPEGWKRAEQHANALRRELDAATETLRLERERLADARHEIVRLESDLADLRTRTVRTPPLPALPPPAPTLMDLERRIQRIEVFLFGRSR